MGVIFIMKQRRHFFCIRDCYRVYISFKTFDVACAALAQSSRDDFLDLKI
jgi:hypothetical protein